MPEQAGIGRETIIDVLKRNGNRFQDTMDMLLSIKTASASLQAEAGGNVPPPKPALPSSGAGLTLGDYNRSASASDTDMPPSPLTRATSGDGRSATVRRRPASQTAAADDKMETLMGLFPGTDLGLIEYALVLNEGNIDDAIDNLLELEVDEVAAREARAAAGKPPAVDAWISETKSCYEETDIFDPRSQVDSMYSEVGDSGEFTEDLPDWGLVKEMLECLDPVTGDEEHRPSALHRSSMSRSRSDSSSSWTDRPDTEHRQQLQRLCKLFPDIPEEAIEAEVERAGGDINEAADRLLAWPGSGDSLSAGSGGETIDEYLETKASPIRSRTRTFRVHDASAANARRRQKNREPRRGGGPASAAGGSEDGGEDWKDRSDVRKSGILPKLPKEEIARQNAIKEIVNSERAYGADVDVLVDLLLQPLHQLCSSQGDVGMTAQQARTMLDTGQKLRSVHREFATRLAARQGESLVVERIHDVVKAMCPALRKAFLAYCATCFHLQNVFEVKNATLEALLQTLRKDPRARSLPLDAFVLAPVQRLARYPMLVDAVRKYTDSSSPHRQGLERVHEQLSEIAKDCNTRLRSLEDHAMLIRINEVRVRRARPRVPICACLLVTCVFLAA